ncbi:MAG: hypothetical protein II837_07490 [Treponema sp.]|nr:hypothetical protein [Treponema sp.]MBQ7166224.1 hypothetical protein [Treponema sp.]
MEESFWGKSFLLSRNILIASLLMAVLCLCVSYPGNLYSDSYGRIELAGQLPGIIRDLLRGRPQEVHSWNTVTPCYFIALFQALTGNLATYTFIQAFFFFFVTLLLIRRIAIRHRHAAYALYLVNPVFFCASIYHETGIGVVIGLVSLILLLNEGLEGMSGSGRFLYFFLIFLSSFVAFGFRANTFTVLPVLLLVIFLRHRSWARRLTCAACLFLGLFLDSFIPRLLKIDTMSSVSLGFIWEMGQNIASMPEKEFDANKDFLDDLFGEGSTLRLCEWANEPGEDDLRGAIRRVASFSWEVADFSREAISDVGLGKIFGRYLSLYARSPATSIKTKLRFISYTLGIYPRLKLKEWDYDRWERGKEFGMSDSLPRHRFMSAYRIAVNRSFLPLRPWLVLLVSLLCVFLKLRLSGGRARDSLDCQMILVSVFYYGAFVLNNQSMEFRYFYPAFYMLSLTIVGSVPFLASVAVSAVTGRSRR